MGTKAGRVALVMMGIWAFLAGWYFEKYQHLNKLYQALLVEQSRPCTEAQAVDIRADEDKALANMAGQE